MLTISDVAAMLARLSPTDVRRRLDELDAESRSLRTLLRTLRARESAGHRVQGEGADA